jgi:hypothetical protein
MKTALFTLAAAALLSDAAHAQGQPTCHYDTFSRATVCERPSGAAQGNPWARSGKPTPGPAGSYYANRSHPTAAVAPAPPPAGPAQPAIGGRQSLYYLSQGVNLQAPPAKPVRKRRCLRNPLLAVSTCR